MALDPAEIRGLLRGRRLGGRIECLAETESTNDDASAAARAGAPEGLVVIADAQRRGRGRLGRQWVSPPGLNLYCSIVLRPALAMDQIPQLTLAAGVAAAETVEAFAGRAAAIKWPNDVQLDGRKVAGILTEMAAAAGRPVFVVVGIGVNLNAAEGDFPPELRELANSIAWATGRTVDRGRFAAHLIDALDARYESLLRHGFSSIQAAWTERDALRGRHVEVRSADSAFRGVARGIAPNGRLRLETETGVEEILAGDVTVAGVAAARG